MTSARRHLPYLAICRMRAALGLSAFALLLGPLGGAAAPVHVLQPENIEAETSRASLNRDRDRDRGQERVRRCGGRCLC